MQEEILKRIRELPERTIELIEDFLKVDKRYFSFVEKGEEEMLENMKG